MENVDDGKPVSFSTVCDVDLVVMIWSFCPLPHYKSCSPNYTQGGEEGSPKIWVGCAAHFLKPLIYFRLKYAIFPPYFRPDPKKFLLLIRSDFSRDEITVIKEVSSRNSI